MWFASGWPLGFKVFEGEVCLQPLIIDSQVLFLGVLGKRIILTAILTATVHLRAQLILPNEVFDLTLHLLQILRLDFKSSLAAGCIVVCGRHLLLLALQVTWALRSLLISR